MVGPPEIYYKLHLCLSLVLLPGGLDTHPHFAADVTLTQPCMCPKAKMRPGSLVPSWPQVDTPGQPGWNLGPSVGGLSSGLHSCHGLPLPGCSAVPHAAMDILAWVPCVSGPWLPALAHLSRPSLLFLVARFTVFLSVPWLSELEPPGQGFTHLHGSAAPPH